MVQEQSAPQRRYVQYGCGGCAPREWQNFDASPTLRFERLPLIGKVYTRNSARFPPNVEYGDVVKGLPVAADSCAAVYCSHVLEHLSLEDFRAALHNTFRILQPGGVFRLVLPDLFQCASRYLHAADSDVSISFMRQTCLGVERRPRSLRDFLVFWLGNSQHLWMWDYASLSRELASAGFVAVRRAAYGDSSDPMFRQVEQKDRWDDCLGIECARPVPALNGCASRP